MCVLPSISLQRQTDLLDLFVFLRFEDEVMRMVGELEEKEKEYEQCVISLTSVVEMAKVHLPQFLCVLLLHALTTASGPGQRHDLASVSCPSQRLQTVLGRRGLHPFQQSEPSYTIPSCTLRFLAHSGRKTSLQPKSQS